MQSKQTHRSFVVLGIVFLSLGASPQIVVGQEKDPIPEVTIQNATETAKLGEVWLKSKGLYENYEQIRKDFKPSLVSAAWGSGARLMQVIAENIIQRMSISISASRVRRKWRRAPVRANNICSACPSISYSATRRVS